MHSRPALLVSASKRVAAFGVMLMLAACSPKVVPTHYHSDYASFNVRKTRGAKMRSMPLAAEVARGLEWAPTVPPKPGDSASTTTLPLTANPTPTPLAMPSANEVVTSPAELQTTITLASDSPTTASAKTGLVLVFRPTVWDTPRTGGLSLLDQSELRRTVRDRLYTWAGRAYPPPVYMRYDLLPGDPLLRKGRAIYIESAITDLKGGNALLRYFVGYGAGSVVLQIEGRVRADRPDGPILAEYALRIPHNGYPQMGWNLKSFSDLYCFQHASNQASYEFFKGLRSILPPPPMPKGYKGFKFK